MATAVNEITGSVMKTKPASDAFSNGYDSIDWSNKGDKAKTAESHTSTIDTIIIEGTERPVGGK